MRNVVFAVAAIAGLGCAAQAGWRDAVTGMTPVIDLRARFEDIDDAGKVPLAQAATLRARLGFETGSWEGLRLAVDFDQIAAFGGPYNSTRNGKTAYPVVADPPMTALNRLQLSYVTGSGTKIVVGRQRIQIGNQRFIGNAGWRQHEQTFDAVSLVNTSTPGLTVTYAYLERVNRVGGPDIPVPSTTAAAATGQASHYESNSHVIDVVYTGFPGLRLESYAFLLDLGAPAYARTLAQRTATAKLSTATWGGRVDYSLALPNALTAKLAGEAAHQTNYAANPLSYGVDYWLTEASLVWQGVTGSAGYESLGGDGTIGFSMPLASLHPFNGWADMFVTTPADGLDDAYFKASYAAPADLGVLKSVSAAAVHHRYSTVKFAKGIGSEWDAQAELDFKNSISLLLSYADYQGSNVAFGGFPDKSELWLQAAYVY